ncbi:MAG: SpoIIE family protein phosphatase [Dehalococcoidia bacterium]|nr:SpoIIE family protein phosphatase [Dehalococcoidia bacterium]
MDLGIATRPKANETSNGDAYFVGEHESTVLFAMIDGLGHGEQANDAANKTTAFLASHLQQDLVSLIKGCHQELRGSRGAVIGIASIDRQTQSLKYAGVGNIESRIVTRAVTEGIKVSHLISMNGIVGCNLGRVNAMEYPFHVGDIIVMFSDGISSRLNLSEFLPVQNLQAAAEKILIKHGKDDDATVLLARL